MFGRLFCFVADLDTDDHRVSLTQRLSRICVDDVDTVDGDMQGTSQSSLVSASDYYCYVELDSS